MSLDSWSLLKQTRLIGPIPGPIKINISGLKFSPHLGAPESVCYTILSHRVLINYLEQLLVCLLSNIKP